MKNNTLIWITIFISISSLVSSLTIERIIYLKYISSDGKTRALFGLTELAYLEIKFYLIIIALIGLILSIIALIKKRSLLKSYLSLSASILAIIISIIRVWRWFV